MTVGDTLRQTARRWPDSDALVTDARQLTYRELSATTNRFANGLREAGVEAGDAVGLVSANSVEQVLSYLAVQTLGAVAVPVNPRLSPEELGAILGDAEASAVVCDGNRAAAVEGAAETLSALSLRITTDARTATETGMRSFDDVLADDASPPAADVALTEPGVMMHTSGTTGRPKLVVLTHQGQLLNSMACAVELDIEHEDRLLHVAPLYHSAGYLNLLLPGLQLGATHVLQADFDPEATLERVERERATVSLAVPTHFQLLRETDPAAYDLSSLHTLVTSGAPIAADTAAWVVENLCPSLVNVYGLTETCGLVTIDDGSDDGSDGDDGGSHPSGRGETPDRAFRIGEPFLGVEVRLVEVGDDVPPDRTVDAGDRGQLVVRSPKVMTGYYGRPARTRETLRDGWLYTGDVAVERDGVYYLVDRLDNCIISGGENIYPQEVERVLADHPGVRDCAVGGVEDATLGERVVAYVVPADPSLTLADVDSFWRARTDAADFKRPRELRLVESIPRNDSGKVLREELGDDA